MAAFKIGDRVELIEDYGTCVTGEQGVVDYVEDDFDGLAGVQMDKGNNLTCYARRLRLVPQTPQEPAVGPFTVSVVDTFGRAIPKSHKGADDALVDVSALLKLLTEGRILSIIVKLED